MEAIRMQYLRLLQAMEQSALAAQGPDAFFIQMATSADELRVAVGKLTREYLHAQAKPEESDMPDEEE